MGKLFTKDNFKDAAGGLFGVGAQIITDALDSISDRREERLQQQVKTMQDNLDYENSQGADVMNNIYNQMIKRAADVQNSTDLNKYGLGGDMLGGMASAALSIQKSVDNLMSNGYELENDGLNALASLPGFGFVKGLFGTRANEAEQIQSLNSKRQIARNMGAAGIANSFDDAAFNRIGINTESEGYSGGIFSGVGNKNRDFQLSNVLAKQNQDNAISNGIYNVSKNQMADAIRSYQGKFGGRLFKEGGLFPELTHGGIFSNGIRNIDAGSTHENNPNGGVNMGIAPDGIKNTVEEGEKIWNDYVFSARLKPRKKFLDKYHIKKDMSFADVCDKFQKESEETPNDPITKRGLEANLGALMQEQEEVRRLKELRKLKAEISKMSPNEMQMFLQQLGQAVQMQEQMQEQQNQQQLQQTTDRQIPQEYLQGLQQEVPQEYSVPQEYIPNACGGHLHACGGHMHENGDIIRHKYELPTQVTSTFNPLKDFKEKVEKPFIIESRQPKKYDYSKLIPLFQAAPIFGNTLNAITAGFDKPNYSHADALIKAGTSVTPNIPIPRIGNYAPIKLFDTNYGIGTILNNTNGANRNIMNLSSGNSGTAITGILNNTAKTNDAIGNLLRENEKFNYDNELARLKHNADIDKTNATLALQGNSQNAQLALQDNAKFLQAVQAGEALKQNENERYRAGIYNPINGIFSNLGLFGNQLFMNKLLKKHEDKLNVSLLGD